MTISCWRWLKTAINGGNLWSTAPQSKDDDDDDDDDELTGPTQGSLSHIDSLDILIHLTCSVLPRLKGQQKDDPFSNL